jgi:hypothetical protein
LAPGSQLKLTRAVLEAGVSRYFPWQYGIDYDVVGGGSAQDLFDEQLEVRNLLRSSSSSSSPTSVDWIIVSTGVFMSFLLVPEFGPVDMNNRGKSKPPSLLTLGRCLLRKSYRTDSA